MKELNTGYLRQKRKRLMKQLKEIEPVMLRGSLIERYKRCGKSNCHCLKGKGHGPAYYLSVSMPGGTRPVIIYVPVKFKTEIEKALANYRKAQKLVEEISSINRELFIRRALF